MDFTDQLIYANFHSFSISLYFFYFTAIFTNSKVKDVTLKYFNLVSQVSIILYGNYTFFT